MTKKAILYCRFSPRKDASTSESNDFQLDKCREYCEQHKYTVKGEYQDKALSGADADRPGLWQAVDALRKGYILVVYKLDRLARDVYLSYIIEHTVLKAGAKIESTNGEGTWNDTPDDELIRGILNLLAQHQRKVNNVRTKAAMLRMQSNGRTVSSRPPYGWEFDPDSPMLVKVDKDNKPHETVPSRMRECAEEQAVIKQVLEYHAQGLSLRAVCRKLHEAGIEHRGGSWYHGQAKTILKRAGAI